MSDASLVTDAIRSKIETSPYYSEDLGPTRPQDRNWRTRDMAVLWISMAACIPTYSLASGMIEQGMNWSQAIITILLGNLIVLVPLVLNAHPGTKYGIPFPVYCRSSFGILGANIPAMLRAMVACGWFGIQCWIGGQAIYMIINLMMPSLSSLPNINFLGINAAQFGCFMFFWAINMAIILRGIESIRLLLNIKAPLLVLLGLCLLAWAYFAAHGFGPMLSKPSDFVEGGVKQGKFWSVFFPALTANIGFWSTLSLNIPDFSRFAKSQRQQIIGQVIGLPTTMALFAFIGVAVTSATFVIYGETIWDPIVVLTKFTNPIVLMISLLALCIATLATNIAANIVGPANDFANLSPGKISFRMGAIITGVIGIIIQLWRLISDPDQYILVWLGSYSSLLGAVGGILIADYYLIRRTVLKVEDLYRADGEYFYWKGINPIAIVALVIGVAPCIPGFIGTISPKSGVPMFWVDLYAYTWFISFGLSLVVYAIGMKTFGATESGRE